MNLDEMSYLAVVWFVGNGEGDWMAFVYRDKSGALKLTYRFRYYLDDKAHDSKDRKNWYEVIAGTAQTEADMVSATDLVAAMSAKRYGNPVDRIEVRGEPIGLLELIKDRPWAHRTEVPIS